jgi:hypothetical protein
MKAIKLMLSVSVLAIAMLTGLGSSQDTWSFGSSGDWLSSGPVYHSGPFYIPNSDLPIGTQRFLNNYPGYSGYPNYMPATPYYYPGYNNPYFYDPQYQLDLAAANHAYQKYLSNYYNRYYGSYYPYWMWT